MDCVGLCTSFQEALSFGDLNPRRSSAWVLRQAKKTDNIAFRFGRSFNAPIAMQNGHSIKDVKSRTLYEILGIGENASGKDIRAAYRKLAKRFHPDALPPALEIADGAAFVEIHHAYAILADPHDRAAYDRQLRASAGDHRPGQSHRYYYPYYRRARSWETDQCW